MIIYVVKKGDSLYSISKEYGVNYLNVAYENEIPLTQDLVIGQTIVINGAGDTKKLGTIEVNGYTYTNINDATLNKTLPYLTYLSIFNHNAMPDGSISDIDDSRLIEVCKKYSVMPFMVITNIEDGITYSSDLAHTILSNESKADKLITGTIKKMKDKGYYGLEIDFEYIYPHDKEAYTNFLQKASQALKSEGYFLNVSLAPKTSSTQKGKLYEAYDYSAAAQAAGRISFTDYGGGCAYGKPMAIAPIDKIKQVHEYALTYIPAQKTLMSIPNYGYVWELPYNGLTAKATGNYQAADTAEHYNSEIKFDDISQSPYFTYYDKDKVGHTVWFEDARSINAKLRLAAEYELCGVGFWPINKFFPQGWLVFNSLYDVKKNI